MRRIYVKDLRAGQVLPKALFTTTGLKLLPAGARLSRSRVSSLRRSYSGPLYLAASYNELRQHLSGEADAGPSGPIEHGLHTTKRSPEDQKAYDARKEWMREIRRAERVFDEQLAVWAGLERRIEPALKPVELARPGRLGWPAVARLRAYRNDRARRVAVIHRALMLRQRVEAAPAAYLVRELIDLFVGYPERFARVVTLSPGDEHPGAEHALRVGALAAAVAVRMGWSLYDAQRAGVAGLFADLGMILEPLQARGSLDEVAAARLRRHPISSAVMLETMDDLPEAVRLAVSQHHERLDGSGYPLGLRGEPIHDIARVLAVCDSFVAAITPRPHRSALRPHAALVDVCRASLDGALDRRAAMALVRVTGVFPVGAAVALDTGDAAVVVSSHAARPDRPTLRLLADPGAAGAADLGELDLLDQRDVRITAELAPGEHRPVAA